MPKTNPVSSSSVSGADGSGSANGGAASATDALQILEQDDSKCKYCLEKIRGYCAVCIRCRGVRLCFRCLAWGVEGGSHVKEHPYRLLAIREGAAAAVAACAAAAAAGDEPSAHLSIFEDDMDPWSCDEEIRLVDSIDVFGVGNWHDVAEQVGGTHSPDECVAHYGRFYLRGALGRALLPSTRVACRVQDHTTALGAPLSPSLYQILPSSDMGLDEQQLLGFMPNRDDFERDYDNDAESILCKLSPSFEEDDLDNALKVAQIDIYTHRLRERQRRKNIARKHGLIPRIMAAVMAATVASSKKNGSSSSISSNSSSMSTATTSLSITPSRSRRLERYDAFNIEDKFKPIVRYLEPDEGRQFFDNISREARLREEIALLADKRRKGMQKLTAELTLKIFKGPGKCFVNRLKTRSQQRKQHLEQQHESELQQRQHNSARKRRKRLLFTRRKAQPSAVRRS